MSFARFPIAVVLSKTPEKARTTHTKLITVNHEQQRKQFKFRARLGNFLVAGKI